MGPLSPAALAAFVKDGAVTVDTGVPDALIAAASAAVFAAAPRATAGATRSGRTCDFFDGPLLDVIGHPWFEQAAQQVLQAEAGVTFFQTAIINAWPDLAADRAAVDLQALDGYHTDMQYTVADLLAAPRRMQCSFFVWLSDVPLGRANLMCRPGTHRLMAEHHAENLAVHLMPRICGTPKDAFPTGLALPPAVPVVATAGQATMLTTGMMHSASPNFDSEPRQCFVITFTPSDVEVGLPARQAEAKRMYDRGLRERLPAARRHIVAGPDDAADGLYGREYYRKWLQDDPTARL